MNNRPVSFLLGGSALRQPVRLRHGVAYLRLLSVLEALLCEAMSRGLLSRLKEEGITGEEARASAENACLCACCLVDGDGKALFETGFCALETLLPEELALVAEEYAALRAGFLGWERGSGEEASGAFSTWDRNLSFDGGTMQKGEADGHEAL